MATQAAGTLDADAETCGPIDVLPNGRGSVQFIITSTITVTLQRRFAGGGWVTCPKPDGTAAAYTASSTFLIDGPGEYQLVASGVSGGAADCKMWAHA